MPLLTAAFSLVRAGTAALDAVVFLLLFAVAARVYDAGVVLLRYEALAVVLREATAAREATLDVDLCDGALYLVEANAELPLRRDTGPVTLVRYDG